MEIRNISGPTVERETMSGEKMQDGKGKRREGFTHGAKAMWFLGRETRKNERGGENKSQTTIEGNGKRKTKGKESINNAEIGRCKQTTERENKKSKIGRK